MSLKYFIYLYMHIICIHTWDLNTRSLVGYIILGAKPSIWTAQLQLLYCSKASVFFFFCFSIYNNIYIHTWELNTTSIEGHTKCKTPELRNEEVSMQEMGRWSAKREKEMVRWCTRNIWWPTYLRLLEDSHLKIDYLLLNYSL